MALQDERASGLVARAVVLKFTPTLRFVMDDSLVRGNRVMQIIEEENLIGNAQKRGAQLLAGLELIAAKYPWIESVRGAGLIAGSVSLIADSLDMLGDALVYGFSLYVITRNDLWKARSASVKGWIMLGFGVFALVFGAAHVWAAALLRAGLVDGEERHNVSSTGAGDGDFVAAHVQGMDELRAAVAAPSSCIFTGRRTRTAPAATKLSSSCAC